MPLHFFQVTFIINIGVCLSICLVFMSVRTLFIFHLLYKVNSPLSDLDGKDTYGFLILLSANCQEKYEYETSLDFGQIYLFLGLLYTTIYRRPLEVGSYQKRPLFE